MGWGLVWCADWQHNAHCVASYAGCWWGGLVGGGWCQVGVGDGERGAHPHKIFGLFVGAGSGSNNLINFRNRGR